MITVAKHITNETTCLHKDLHVHLFDWEVLETTKAKRHWLIA